MRTRIPACCIAALLPLFAAAAPPDQDPRPSYTAAGALNLPADYREVGVPQFRRRHALQHNSGATAGVAMRSTFDNVFVDPASWRQYKASGRWPDQTMLVLENRAGTSAGSINKGGKFQTEERVGLEVHVRDAKRFQGGWAFFVFSDAETARRVPYTQDCYACHREHGAVDTTFVQFYPTAKTIAQKSGTLHEP